MNLNKIKFFNLNSNQKNRLKKNIFSGFTTETFQIISQIFFAPLMIFFWGVDNFGIWVFLLSIPNIFLIFNINFTDASIHELTKFNTQKKFRKAEEIFQNSLILILLNIFIFTSLILLFYYFNKIDFTILKDFTKNEIFLILILLIISIYFNLIGSIFTTVLNSQGKIYYGYNIGLITDLLSKLSIAISGFFFESLFYPALIFLAYTIIKFILNYYFFLLHKKNLFFSFNLVSKQKIVHLAKLSIGHTADLLTNVTKNSGIIIILGIFYDPYLVGYIATVRTLFYFFPIRFIGKLTTAISYEFSRLFSENKKKFLKKYLYTFSKLTFFLTTILFILSMTIGPFIYKLWLNNKYQLDVFFLLIILIDTNLFILRNSIVSLFSAINKNLILGLSELFLILITITLFYLINSFGYSYLYAFTCFIIGSLLSLLFAIKYSMNYFKL